ncbi:MAG: HupE/UreJ family protein [Acidobacteriota bacterium]
MEGNIAWRRGLALSALALISTPCLAHELGTVRTVVDFRRDGTYRVEVFIDREHLPAGFAAAAVTPVGPIRGLPSGEAAGSAGPILAEVANHCEPRFDGRLAHPDLEWVGPDPAAKELILSLTGPIPGGAREFTWRNSLPIGSYLLTLRTEGKPDASRVWVEGGRESEPFALSAQIVPPTLARVAGQYLRLGYTHILPKGADHILFVLGIFLLSRRGKPILWQVTAFTVAHTITLGLTIYGIVSLRPAIVEPLIALSIVYVAVEDVFTSRLSPWRIALVFGFGLVHGMGFAGVLSQLGLPRSQFLPALVCFNAGVELGQLTVIAAAFALVGLPFRGRPWYHRRVAVPLSLAIAAVGLYGAITRAAGTISTLI